MQARMQGSLNPRGGYKAENYDPNVADPQAARDRDISPS